MAITVTAAQSGTGAFNGVALTVKVVTGASQTQHGTTAGSTAVTVPDLSITPAATGSWVYGAVFNNAAAGTFTAAAGTTFSQNQYWSGDTAGFGTFRTTGTTTAATPVTVGGSAPSGSAGQFQVALCEILAASGASLAEDPSAPASAYTTTATTVSTGSFTPPAGALLVATVAANCTGTANQNMTLAVTDSSGLTWTKNQVTIQTSGTTGTFEKTSVWTARVPSNGSQSGGSQQQTLSLTSAGSALHWGDAAFRFTGSAGTGTSVSAQNAQTIAITTTGDHSAIVVLVLDWNGVSGAGRTWLTLNGYTPAAGAAYEITYVLDTGNYGVYCAYWPDAGKAGTYTVGLSAPGGMKPTIIAVEVLGIGGATAVTGPATNVTVSGATLNGTVNPGGMPATWQFEYGPDTGYGTTIPATPASAGSGTAPLAESYILAGLPAGATYHYRLNAINSSGTAHGADQTFTTTTGSSLAGGPATPLPGWPQLIIEAGLLPDSPSQGSTSLFLNVGPGLDTARLGTSIAWTDISQWVLGFTVSRPSTRLQGPLWNYQAGTASITLDNSDGRFDVDNTAGPYYGYLTPMVPVRIRAVFAGTGYPLYSGFDDGWLPAQVTYEGGYTELTVNATDAFKVLAGITLPAVTTEGAGASTGARIKDILSRAGWYTSGERNVISAGNSALQGTPLGDTALNLMQIAVDSEIGQLYVNGSGAVVFRGRRDLLTDTRSNTVQAVFGDLPGTAQAAGTELACAALTRASDDTTISNDIQATRTGGTLQEVKDAASIAKYLFPRVYSRSDLILQDDPAALSWAQWVLYLSKGAEDRFESLTVDPLADQANLWPQVLGREIGDRIQVWNRPAGVAAPISRDCFIAGMTHTWDSATSAWSTTWTLQDASKYGSFLTLDNATLGKLDGNALTF